jgi:iron-sulfur cluster assembly protein
MIQLSKAAASEIERLQSKQQLIPNMMFRLAVKPGGCSGMYYDMSFEQTPGLDDRTVECQGIRIVIDNYSLNYIQNLTVDYSEDLMGGGFRFHNSIAIATCGCGNSFSVNE